jgi:putative ABC transport system substrate-binding protein
MHSEVSARTCKLTSVAILWNPRNSAAELQAKATEAGARSLRLTSFSVEVTSQSDLDGALQLLYAKRPTGLIIIQDPVMLAATKRLAEFAIKNRLPAFHPYRVFARGRGFDVVWR